MHRTKIIVGKVAFDYHRNGIGGVGFYSARFNARIEEAESEPMVAVIIPFESDEPFERGHCFVLAVKDLLDSGPLRNWRGDNFEDELRPLLYQAQAYWRYRMAESLEGAPFPYWPIIVGEDVIE